jgi:DNA-binding NtrC family response regulator
MANILLIDDEEQMLRLLGQTLARDGHVCATAKNAA